MDLFCSGGHSQWGTARTCAEWHFRRAAGIALERNPAERIYLSDHVVPVSADGRFQQERLLQDGAAMDVYDRSVRVCVGAGARLCFC